MRRPKSAPLRGSVTQNNVSVRMRARERSTGPGVITRLGIALTLLLIITAGCYGLWHAGWPQRKAAEIGEDALTLSQRAHFAVANISVDGLHMTRSDAAHDALGIEKGDPIFAFDAKNAATRLGRLPWVSSAIVERRLPDSVNVFVTERIPTARWQHDEKTYVIDGEGKILLSANPDDFSSLPFLVGAGADSEAQAFLTLLGHYPDIMQKMDSAVRVSERRWDLHLQPKVTVRLPEQDVGAALHRLSVLITQDKMLDRDIAAVDLRLPDRLYVEPRPPAAPATKGPHT